MVKDFVDSKNELQFEKFNEDIMVKELVKQNNEAIKVELDDIDIG